MISRRLRQTLRRAHEARSMLRIDRRPKFADRVDGIVLRIGEQWILVAQTAAGGYFDGYVLLRSRDIARIAPDTSFAHQFIRMQPEWPPAFPFDVDLDDAASAVGSLASRGELVGMQKENERSAIWIGTLHHATSRFISLNEVRPDATWHPRPLGYKLRSITMVEVVTRYLLGLWAVAGAGASSVRNEQGGGAVAFRIGNTSGGSAQG